MVRKIYGEKTIKHLIYDLQKALDNKTEGKRIISMLEKKVVELKGKDYYKVVWYENKKPNRYKTIEQNYIEQDNNLLIREGIINEE